MSGREDLQHITLGSIAAAVALGYLDFRHDALGWRTDRANLNQFYDTFLTRDSMINTALKT